MKLASAKDVIAVARSRGLEVVVKPGPPPMPVLRVPSHNQGMATEALLDALRAWRLEIIEELTAASEVSPAPELQTLPAVSLAIRLREWLWSAGNYYRERPYVAAMPQYEGKHPWGAGWWRFRGDPAWLPVSDEADLGDASHAEVACERRYGCKPWETP